MWCMQHNFIWNANKKNIFNRLTMLSTKMIMYVLHFYGWFCMSVCPVCLQKSPNLNYFNFQIGLNCKLSQVWQFLTMTLTDLFIQDHYYNANNRMGPCRSSLLSALSVVSNTKVDISMLTISKIKSRTGKTSH